MSQARPQPAWARFAPGLDVLLHYDRTWLRGDLLAGLTVAAYLIPQVMAYAEIARLPAITGLWAILCPLALYALLGSSRQLSVGPESTTALMTAAGAGALAGTLGPGRWADVAALLAIGVGLICLIGWVARAGFLANLLSRPVLVGYMAGIAVLMIVSQLGKVTGLKLDGESVGAELWSLARQAGNVHWPTFALALAVLVALFAFRAWAPTWPGPLIGMLAAAGAVAAFGLQRQGIEIIGTVPTGLPVPRVPNLADVRVLELVPYAAGIAVVGYTDNVLTARAFAAKHRQRIDPGQELLALGVVNVANGFANGFPVSSSGSRTVLGDAMGSKSQLHSLVALGAVVATLSFLAPLLASFPVAALGAVVIYAALRLVDVAEIRRIAAFRRSELILLGLTTAGVLVFDILGGIGLAVALSILDLIRRIVHPHDGILGYVPGVAGMHDVDDYPDATLVPGLLVYRYDSPLFFANAEDFRTRALAAVDAQAGGCEWFVLNAEAVVEVDLTAMDALTEVHDELARRGIEFAMARVKMDLRDDLEAAGIVELVGADRIFPTLPTAVAAYAHWYAGAHGRRPSGLPDGTVGPEP